MSKTYVYNAPEYFRKVTLTGIVGAIVFVVAIVNLAIGAELIPVWVLAALVAGYTVLNTFVARCYPAQVILEEDGISFSAYGKTDKYLFDEITRFSVKDWRGSGRMYLRINKSNMLRGRYWLYCRRCNDGEELFMYILKLEYKTHPTSWKAKAWDSTRPKENKNPILPWKLDAGRLVEVHAEQQIKKAEELT